MEEIEIRTWEELNEIRENLSGNYKLMNDIRLKVGHNWQSIGGDTGPIDSNWTPSVNKHEHFTGRFDGGGHTISNLYINRPYEDWVGLFGVVGSEGIVEDISVIIADGGVTGKYHVGGLVGWNDGKVSGSATGAVKGEVNVGGLVGGNGGKVRGSATGAVTGYSCIGGLVGLNGFATVNGSASGDVTGKNMVGGMVGWNDFGTVRGYATGYVKGKTNIGHLAGWNHGGVIEKERGNE